MSSTLAVSRLERTAAGAMAAEKLRDLSRPMDVPLLDATVAALYGTGSSEERHAADQISRELQNNPDMWLQVAHILQNSQNLNTKLFALQVLENVIKYKWNVLPVEQRDGIKNYISDVIVQLSGNEVSFRQERLYVNKLNIILVQVLKREWPARWTTFIPDLIAEAATSPTICENCMAILKLISEEIFDFSRGEMTQQKVKELKGSLNSEFRLIHELCLQVLPGSQRPELICATLVTLHAFLSWIPIGFIFESQLLETLSKFFPIAAYRNLTLQCLTEVAALHFGDFYNTQYVQMYTVFMLQLQGILPSGTISDRYGNGSNEEQAFIQNLALFLTSFFKNHIRTLESTHDNRAALLLGLDYLIEISFLEGTEMFKVCLDYWNLFVLELFETYMERLLELQAQGIRGTDDGTLIAVQQRRQLYAGPLSKLRALMTCRMKKLEEVLIVEDENGNIVRETLKDNDVIGTFCEIMRETLPYLSHLDHEDTDQQKLSKQLNLEGGGEMDHSKEKLPDDKESIMLELRHELVYTTVLAELYKEDLEEAEKIIQQKDQIIESQNAQLVQGKVCTAKMVSCTCTRKSRCTTVKCSCKAANVLCCDECTCKSICLNKEPPLQRPSEKDGGRRYPSRARKKIEDIEDEEKRFKQRKAQEEDESDRGGSGPVPSTASDDEAVDEASASRVLEKEAAVGGEVVEAKKGSEPRKMVLDGRITKALAALFLLPNEKARMVALYSFKRLQLQNDLNELLIDDIIKCFCKEVRTNKDVVPCFLNFLICIAKETSSYKKCNSQVIRDFEGKLRASAGSVLDILDYLRRRKDLKEPISNEQIAQVLSTWIPFCVSMSWNDLQKHLVVHKTLTKFLKYINWSTDVKGSSCSQSDVKEMEELKKMISELTRQSMVVMEKAIKQKDAAADDSAPALRELERQVKALQLEKKEMEDSLQRQVKAQQLEKKEMEDSLQRQVKALQLEKKEMEDRLQKEMEDRLQKLQIGLQEAEGYRKKLLNENLDLRGNIRVFCRVRPMMVNNIISDELSQHIEYADSIEAKGRGIIVNKKAFLFDKVFQHTTSQTTVFDEVSSLIQSALDGYKVCILSYGQTGSGKTYTMIGSEQQKGITPRSLEKIFNCESAENKSCKYSFEVSIFEIYNNEVKDLLSPRPADLLIPRKLKPNGETGEIQGLVVEEIFSSQHALDLLATATSNRSVVETTMNEHSSRSHLFFNLKITGINEGQKVRGRLSLVDLAGSGRVANNDNNHDRVTEGNNINVSLMHLGTVIQAIATKAPHIPFRNCVLTHVLKDYLEGDSKMLMLANIAQEKSSIEETISTLKFASDVNATNIKYIHMMPTCGKGEKSVAGKPPKTPHPSERKVGFH